MKNDMGFGRWRVKSCNWRKSHVRFGSCQPTPVYTGNILVSFISLSAHCCSWLDAICLVKLKGAVSSVWMFSVEASILLKVVLAVRLLVCVQLCFVNPWLYVLKDYYLCFTDEEDRLTSLASLVCCPAERCQLCSFSFPLPLVQHSCYHSNNTFP